MIDTDKYEGHAEGEWVIEMNDTGDECAIHAQDYGTIAQTFYRDHDKLFLATTKLMADAPLLLAEVQRLRELFRIDEGSRDEGYCVTMRLEGCEYIGTLRLYKDEEGKVIE